MIGDVNGQIPSESAHKRPSLHVYFFALGIWTLAVAVAYGLFIVLPGYGAMTVGLVAIFSLPVLVAMGQRNNPDLKSGWIAPLIAGIISIAAFVALVIHPVSRI